MKFSIETQIKIRYNRHIKSKEENIMAKDFNSDELYDILSKPSEGEQLDAFITFFEKYKGVIFLDGNIQEVYDFVYNKCARNESIKVFFDVQSEAAING